MQKEAAPESPGGLTGLFRNRWHEMAIGAAVLAAITMALRPLGGGLSGHDLVWHVWRVMQWHRGLTDGVFYPRFLHDLYGGYGGPVMVFIPPLPYALTEIFVAVGSGPVFALELGIALFLAVGAVGLFFFARPALGGPAAALSAAAYALAPYRLLDAYVRLAYSELLVTALLPFMLIAIRRAVLGSGGPAVVLGALATASIVLTHPSSSVFCLPLAAAYGLWCIHGLESGRRRPAVVRLGTALLLGIALSAFYTGPAVFEQRYSKLPEAFSSTYQPHEHLLWPRQLVAGDWNYGASVPGPDDTMGFQLGWVHGLALIAAAWFALRGKAPVRREMQFWLAASAVSLFFVLRASSWFWEVIPFLSVIQWPWRLMVITALASSLAVGASVRLISEANPRARTAVVILVIGLMLPSYYPFTFRGPRRLTDAQITPDLIRASGIPLAELMFMPRAAKLDMSAGPRAAVIGGSAELEILDDRTHFLNARVTAHSPATLRFRIYDFPGWKAEVEGLAAVIRTDEIGAITVDVEEGRHLLTLKFCATALAKGSRAISLAALLLSLAILWRSRRAPGSVRERPA